MSSSSNETGPYKHYERPTEGRAHSSKHRGAVKWIIAIIVVAVIVVIAAAWIRAKTLNQQAANTNSQPEKISQSSSVKSSSKSSSVKIPQSKPSMPAKSSAPKIKQPTDAGEVPTSYVVKYGDALSEISQRYHISMNKLMKINGITNVDQIRPGQTIKLK